MMMSLDLLQESLSREGEAPPATRRHVDVLREELHRLSRSLSGILTQTVPGAPAERFDLAASLTDLVALLAPQARRQAVELETRLPEEPLPVRGYPDRLRQAFLNVAVNALEAMPRGDGSPWKRDGTGRRPRWPCETTAGHPPGGPAPPVRPGLQHEGWRQRHRPPRGARRRGAARGRDPGEERARPRHGRPRHRPPRCRRCLTPPKPHALLVDDDLGFVLGLAEAVQREGFTVSTATTLAQAREEIARQEPDALLVDLQLPDGSGLDLVQPADGRLPPGVVFITGHASVDLAVEALRRGAADFLTKPVDLARVKMALANLGRTRELSREIGVAPRRAAPAGPLRDAWSGRSARCRGSTTSIGKVAPTESTVLVIGETGTGKELVAETMHAMSRRREKPFLPVNCGAIAPGLIESELFGHERGSFTGAERSPPGLLRDARTAARSSWTRSPRCRSSCR